MITYFIQLPCVRVRLKSDTKMNFTPLFIFIFKFMAKSKELELVSETVYLYQVLKIMNFQKWLRNTNFLLTCNWEF